MVPAFAEHVDAPLEVEGLGTLTVDVAFGGVYYVIPRARELGFAIAPDAARDMVALGARIKAAAQEQLTVRHPEIPALDAIEFLMFTDEVDDNTGRNATIMPPGRVDRSPCGTGTAARLAVMYARGRAAIGQPFEMRSTIGSTFRASILGTTAVGDRRAVLPRITGRAWIYAFMQLGADPDDPYPQGFTLADTWGTEMDHNLPGL